MAEREIRPGTSRPWRRGRRGRRLAAVGFGLFCLICLELGLRVGVNLPSRSRILQKSGSPPAVPFFVKRKNFWETSPAFVGRAHSVRFPVPKPAGVFRVIALGDSTVYGFPFGERGSFVRFLEVMLSAASSGRVEVVNCGILGAASADFLSLVPELLSAQPDALILYMGHNEFLESRARRPRFWSRWIYQIHCRLLSSALYRLAVVTFHSLPPREEGGAEYYSRLRREGKPPESGTAFVPESLRREVEKAFRENLAGILRAGRQADVPLLLCLPAANLKDFAPGGSVLRKKLCPKDRRKWEELFRQGDQALAGDQPETALSFFEAAAALDDTYARLRFLRGKALLGAGRPEEARQEFLAAVEQDDLPLRAVSFVYQAMVEAGRSPGVFVVELPAAFARHSPSRLPGREWFLDNVHPDLAGHLLIAQSLLAVTAAHNILPVSPEWTELSRLAGEDYLRGLPPRFIAESYLIVVAYLEHQGRLQAAQELLLRSLRLLPRDAEMEAELARLRSLGRGRETSE